MQACLILCHRGVISPQWPRPSHLGGRRQRRRQQCRRHRQLSRRQQRQRSRRRHRRLSPQRPQSQRRTRCHPRRNRVPVRPPATSRIHRENAGSLAPQVLPLAVGILARTRRTPPTLCRPIRSPSQRESGGAPLQRRDDSGARAELGAALEHLRRPPVRRRRPATRTGRLRIRRNAQGHVRDQEVPPVTSTRTLVSLTRPPSTTPSGLAWTSSGRAAQRNGRTSGSVM